MTCHQRLRHVSYFRVLSDGLAFLTPIAAPDRRSHHTSYVAPNWRRILASSNGMWIQFAVAKTAMGASNIGQAPAHTAMPRVTTTSPRYMGLRVKRYGPMVTSLRLAGEVGLTSVPSRRNMMIAQTGRIQGTVTRAMPSAGSGKPGILGQPSGQLIATAKRT